MTRVEYIRLSHRRTNRKIRERLQAVRTRLDAKSRWLGGAWQAIAWVLYGAVSVVSWLAFAAEIFKDNHFSLHYMECEIEHCNLSAPTACLPARRTVADNAQQAAGAAARIVECIPIDYPEMAVGRRKQRLFHLKIGQTADGERPLIHQTDGRDHRPPQRTDDSRLHRGTGSRKLIVAPSSL